MTDKRKLKNLNEDMHKYMAKTMDALSSGNKVFFDHYNLKFLYLSK